MGVVVVGCTCWRLFFLIAFVGKALSRNVTVILCINYVIIICVYNNTVVNNNYRRLKNLILLFKISMVTRKNLFEISGQFVPAPSNR
jgi:hypothetical protein